MNLLIPKSIADNMISADTTVSEPAPDETVWESGASYTIGNRRIRTSTHRVYACIAAHSGRAIPPESDTGYWTDADPTQRWAPFDTYVSTPAGSTGSLTYVIRPGFFNALALYGLVGTQVSVLIKDAPNGAVIYSHQEPLYKQAADWYQYLFVTPAVISKIYLSDLPIRPDAEISITVSAGATSPVAIGMIALGDQQTLVGDLAEFGGTRYGATAEPVTYSYIDTDPYGKTSIKRRHSATGMRASILLPVSNADQAVDIIKSVLDVPVACIAVNAKGYAGLNVFGLISAKVSYDSSSDANIDMTVKGMI